MTERERQKAEWEDYRERARLIFNLDSRLFGVKVPLNANVQVCEGGAFVEAVVWVPKSC